MENFSFCAVQFELQYKDGWYNFFQKLIGNRPLLK